MGCFHCRKVKEYLDVDEIVTQEQEKYNFENYFGSSNIKQELSKANIFNDDYKDLDEKEHSIPRFRDELHTKNNSSYNTHIVMNDKLLYRNSKNDIYKQNNQIDRLIEFKYFEDELLSYYNQIRTNPTKYIKYLEALTVIEEGEIFKITIEDKKIVFKEDIKIYIHKAIKDINSILSYCLFPMVPNDLIRIIVPNDSWSNYSVIDNLVKEKRKSLIDTEFKYFAFNIDNTVYTPFQTFILQIIDVPFDGIRRRNILNPKFKYCSISVMLKMDDNESYVPRRRKRFGVYISFS